MKKLYIIEVDESDIVECWNERAVKEIGYQEYALKQCPKIKVRPYNYSGDCISREALKEKLQARYDNGEEDFDKGYNIGLEAAIDLIDNASAVEVKPQGEWINREAVSNTIFPFWERYECNQCHKFSGYSNFCPNCGADMRKGGADE